MSDLSENLKLFLKILPSEQFLNFEYRLFVASQKKILKKFEIYLPSKLRKKAKDLIKEGDIYLLYLYSDFENMKINKREFLSKLTDHLDSPQTFSQQKMSWGEQKFLSWLKMQEVLTSDELVRALELVPKLSWEERFDLERHLLGLELEEKVFSEISRRYIVTYN